MQIHLTRYGVLCLVFFLASMPALAEVPATISVQGRLTDDAGVPVPSGTKTFTFRIYDGESGGSFVWEETVGVLTDEDGLWTAHIGSFNPLTPSLFRVDTRWLEITVNDGVNPPETLSRVKLDCSPFGFRSAEAEMADTAIHVRENAISSSHIQDASVLFDDLAQNGAAYDDVVRWNGSDWVAGPETGDVSEIVAGTGLYGDAISGVAHLNVGAGPGINVGADAISVDIGGLAGSGLSAAGVALNVGAGPGISVDAATVSLDGSAVAGVGLHAAGAVLSVDDSRYVNEGQGNSVFSSMIVDHSVRSEDLLDEPGQTGTYCDTIKHLTSTISVVMSKAINCPADGYVLVMASVTLKSNKAVSVDQDAAMGVSSSPAAFIPASQLLLYGLSGGFTGTNYCPLTFHGVYPVTAGYHTFYLIGKEYSGDVQTINGQMTLLFIPTSYN